MSPSPSAAPTWFDVASRTLLGPLSPAGARARLSIVIFHRVLPEPDPLFPDDPDVQRFDALCRWFAAWFNVLPLDQAVQRLQAGTLPARALAITFDDGYADNHDLAMPILQRHGLCATFFIATGFLDGGRMWNDVVVDALRHCRASTLDLSPLGLPGLGAVDLQGDAARRASLGRVLLACKYLEPAQRRDVVQQIESLAGTGPRPSPMMSTAQVRAMAAGGMQIGAHTVTHPILARLSDDDARAELQQSRQRLQEILERPVTLFAYPNGKPGQDYAPRDVRLAQEAGFTAAVSTVPGAARRDGLALHELPRFTPWDRGRAAFAVRMARNLASA